MLKAILPLLLAVGCTGNNGVKLVDATPEQAEEVRVALDELRAESGGIVDYYLSPAGSVSVAVIPFDYRGGDQKPEDVRANHLGYRVYVYPLGQGTLFAHSVVHEILHIEGLKHVSDPAAVMAPSVLDAEALMPTCLHAADVAALCQLEGCEPSALPAPCE